MWDKQGFLFFPSAYIWISRWPSTIFKRPFPQGIVDALCHKSSKSVCVGLFLGSLFCSIFYVSCRSKPHSLNYYILITSLCIYYLILQLCFCSSDLHWIFWVFRFSTESIAFPKKSSVTYHTHKNHQETCCHFDGDCMESISQFVANWHVNNMEFTISECTTSFRLFRSSLISVNTVL